MVLFQRKYKVEAKIAGKLENRLELRGALSFQSFEDFGAEFDEIDFIVVIPEDFSVG